MRSETKLMNYVVNVKNKKYTKNATTQNPFMKRGFGCTKIFCATKCN